MGSSGRAREVYKMRGMTDLMSGCLRAEWSLKRVRASVAAGLVVALLALPPVALGTSSSVAAYSRPGGTEQADVAARNAASARSSSGMLPFTGLDLWWLGGGGVLLIGFGVLLAALARGGGHSATRATPHGDSGARVTERETAAHYSLR
jgi:hypothetical protein